MLIKAVIFDMDGTIISSHGIWDEIVASFVGKDNIDLFIKLRNNDPGNGIEKTCNVLKTAFNYSGTFEEITQLYQDRAQDFFARSAIDFIPGFQEFHEHLRTQNILTGLATDAPNYALDVLKPKLALRSFFGDHIYNSCMVSTFKPNPAVFQQTIDQLNIEPEHCVVFEDSLQGVEAAKNLGLFCVGIIRQNNAAELGRADLTIKDYNGLSLEFLQSQRLITTKATQVQERVG